MAVPFPGHSVHNGKEWFMNDLQESLSPEKRKNAAILRIIIRPQVQEIAICWGTLTIW
jgi:hypothetical protein